MRDINLRIQDKSGNTFKLYVSTPGAGTKIWRGITEDMTAEQVTGSWRSLNKGFLRYNFGKTRSRFSHNGDRTTKDLLVLGPTGTEGIETYDRWDKFGIQLFEYEDVFGVNDEGEGFVIQPWVVTLEPGRIQWSKLWFRNADEKS
jgi:hypothetical protein